MSFGLFLIFSHIRIASLAFPAMIRPPLDDVTTAQGKVSGPILSDMSIFRTHPKGGWYRKLISIHHKLKVEFTQFNLTINNISKSHISDIVMHISSLFKYMWRYTGFDTRNIDLLITIWRWLVALKLIINFRVPCHRNERIRALIYTLKHVSIEYLY